MRLIDADALKESVRAKFKTLPDRCEINELVNAAPTIDAIPEEWLENCLKTWACSTPPSSISNDPIRTVDKIFDSRRISNPPAVRL